jgi:hypothetical protein
MSINKEELELALKMLSRTKGEAPCIGNFFHLRQNPVLARDIIDISLYINTLGIACEKISWERDLHYKRKMNNSQYGAYAGSDIEYFHMVFKTTFDRLLPIIDKISDSPGTIPQNSFNSFFNKWINKPNNKKRLGKPLLNVVLKYFSWFNEIKKVRDLIVHPKDMLITQIFTDKKERNRILFQVTEGFKHKISIPEVMYSDKIVDFEKYAGLYFGYLLSSLERLSYYSFDKFGIQKNLVGIQHGGFWPIVKKWIEALL